MNVRESVTFVGDLAHMLLLGVVFVAGLTVQTAYAVGKRRWKSFRGSVGGRAEPTPASPEGRGD